MALTQEVGIVQNQEADVRLRFVVLKNSDEIEDRNQAQVNIYPKIYLALK